MTLESYEIPIIDFESNKMNYIFFKANSFIIKKYNSELEWNDIFVNIKLLEKFWFIEFKAQLISNTDLKYCAWDKIKFDNETDKTLFMLKWG